MQVKLYSKDNCQYCDKVKNFIKEEGIEGVEFDESRNILEVKKFADQQERMPAFPMLKITDNTNGEEQCFFESEVIIQILKQIYSK